MECIAKGMDRIVVKFEDLVLFGVSHQGQFIAVFEAGEWTPLRDNIRFKSSWFRDALTLSRKDHRREPSKAAEKRAVELCIKEAEYWSLHNQHRMVSAEVARLSEDSLQKSYFVREKHGALLLAQDKAEEAKVALEQFKQQHGIT